MFRLRFAILGAAAALALGAASALAMQGGAGAGDPDAHGDAVASAARTCPHGANGVHGACVSAIASTGGQDAGTETEQTSPAQACRAAGAVEDASEAAPARGDKAAKTAERNEDKAEHRAFAACVSGQSSAGQDS